MRLWAHVCNAEVLHRSGLSAIGDILCHRCLSLFGHVARLEPGVSAHDALRLIVDTYKAEANSQLEKTAGPPSQCLAQQGSGGCQRPTTIYAVKIGDRQRLWSSATVHSDYAMMMMKML